MIDLSFSVLMPVYCKENTDNLKNAIESLLCQTLLPSEIVIVEDGALNDDLYQVIQFYVNKYQSLFTVVKLTQNSGMGTAMDTGLKCCKHEWIARMDSDDLCRNDRFEKQIKFLIANTHIDALGGSIEEFRHVPGDMKQIRILPFDNEEIISFAKARNPINHMTVMFKKQKAIDVGGYWHYRVLEDYHLWYQMLIHGCKFANLPDILVDARVGNNMIGRRKGFAYLKMEVFFFRKMYKSKFINASQFSKAVICRAVMKIIPVRILERLYTVLLRSSKA